MEKKDPVFYERKSVIALQNHWAELKGKHLRELLDDEARNNRLTIQLEKLIFDYTHQRINIQTLELFKILIEEVHLWEKIEAMFSGQIINKSENRSVLHVALRAGRGKKLEVKGTNILPEVHSVIDKIFEFATKVREGKFLGYSGKQLTSFVVIGIGGSHLGVDSVYEAIRHSEECKTASRRLQLKFIPNVDPVDFARITDELDPEQTLFIINSKTFTTAETMLNAKTCRNWLFEKYASKIPSFENARNKIVAHHMCAVCTSLEKTDKFGIDRNNVFPFWDWVGGRFSVWCAIGILPLALVFGCEIVKQFLLGGESIDEHFLKTRDLEKNIPAMLGVLGFYNSFIQGMETRAVLPYSQCLSRFVPHIQQLSMESNGKDVSIDGTPLKYPTSPVVFGEQGTNSQHSFFQLIHQGRMIPCEFIAFIQPLVAVIIPGGVIPNHEELMANFFAQPDALAKGITKAELEANPAIDPREIPFKAFEGNRCSLSLLFNEITPFSIGQLLAIYEHRVAVEGFLFGINSWDQMGVELGKALAKEVRECFVDYMKPEAPLETGVAKLKSASSPTKKLLLTYIRERRKKLKP